jgi:hypothetical protein
MSASCSSLLFVAALVLAGCSARRVPAELVQGVEPGIERTDVERILQQPGIHHVTAAIDGNEVLITTFDVQPWLRVYYVFRNDALEKIVSIPPRRWQESSYKGVPAFRPEPVDPEELLQSTLAAPAVDREWIASEIAHAQRSKEYAEQFLEPEALWLAVAITAPLRLVLLPRDMIAGAQAREVAARFSPWKISTGLTSGEVHAIYGPPLAERQAGDSIACLFGKDLSRHRESVVEVHFLNDRVTRVFSHSFLDLTAALERVMPAFFSDGNSG